MNASYNLLVGSSRFWFFWNWPLLQSRMQQLQQRPKRKALHILQSSSLVRFSKEREVAWQWCSGTIAAIVAPNLLGPIVDHVNLNTPLHDCLTGIDITPADYRIPFAIADVTFLGEVNLKFGYVRCVCYDIFCHFARTDSYSFKRVFISMSVMPFFYFTLTNFLKKHFCRNGSLSLLLYQCWGGKAGEEDDIQRGV